MDEYERRFASALGELEEAGIWRSNANPPYIALIRKLGFRPRLPHYDRFWRVVAGQGLWFAVIWGTMMWLMVWKDQGLLPFTSFAASLIAGVCFGIAMALYYSHTRNRNTLSAWTDL